MSATRISFLAVWFLSAGCHDITGDSESRGVSSTSDSASLEMTVDVDDSGYELDIPSLELSYSQRNGRRLFLAQCAVCHGFAGEGDGFNAFNLDPRPRDLTDLAYMKEVSDQTLHEVITQGGRGVNKSILMPAYGNSLSKSQIKDLVSYVRQLANSKERSE